MNSIHIASIIYVIKTNALLILNANIYICIYIVLYYVLQKIDIKKYMFVRKRQYEDGQKFPVDISWKLKFL